MDTLGNVYVAGTFQQNIAFIPAIFTNAGTGMYLVKYNAGGVFQWAISGIGSGNFLNVAVAVSRAGDVYITGTYNGTVRIGTDTLRAISGTEAFVGRYNSGGGRRWIQRAALGNGSGWGRGISTNTAGDCYITGYFTDTTAFDTMSVISSGGTDAYVAKYDRNGAIHWVTALGGPGNDQGQGIGVDLTGNAYIAGRFSDSVAIAGDTMYTSGGLDAFVGRFSQLGAATWITPIGGAQDDAAWNIAVDAFGNSNVTGVIVDSAMVDTLKMVTYGGPDAFVAKLDGVGGARWTSVIGSRSDDAGYGIAVDEIGSVYVTGYATDTTRVGNQALPLIPNNADVFVVKLNGSGTGQWIRGAGGSGPDEGRAVGADRAGELRVCGMFSDTVQFGPIRSISVGAQDVFIGKLGSDPAITLGFIVEDHFCAGDQFQIPFTVKGVYGNGNYFVAQLSDSNGSFANPVEIGRTFGTGGTIIVGAIPDTTPAGSRYRVRVVSTMPEVASASNPRDLIIYPRPTPVVTPEGPVTICAGDSVILDAGAGYTTYVWNSGDHTRRIVVKQSGQYAVTVSNGIGCTGTSSRVVITVISVTMPGITRTGNVLESTPAAAYQWLLQGSPIAGGTSRSYSPTEDGMYSVTVTDSNGCSATSMPVDFKRGAGVRSENTLAGVALFPHPNTGIFTVRFPNVRAGRVQLSIINALGARVAFWDEEGNGGEYVRRVDIRNQPAGLYFVRVESASGNWTGEVVKR